MDTTYFDYDLPADAIAQEPVEPRDAARLLVDRGPRNEPDHRQVRDLPEYLGPGDLLVLNESRVRRARLNLRKTTGGAVEVLLLEPLEGGRWEVLVRPARRVHPGTELLIDDRVVLVVEDRLEEGRAVVSAAPGIDLEDVALKSGVLPLPPYIERGPEDPERYQTTFGRPISSAAAPTAGLHLTPELLAAVESMGAGVAVVELAVGLGTFRPIASERVEDHRMHSERYRVPGETWEAVGTADRVVAVGTTVARTLESAAATGELEGRTNLFIHGDYPWAAVDSLVTNYHLPRSSLLAMIDAFIGPRWRILYESAIANDYRLLSFGDAMFLPTRGRE